ncbi:hypothetical protein CYLTODRAFT_443992 [Cylindrobasidium torrendii FP15055 ss-10]|uniref:Crossover junction endonuclease MUS81 n=1 Tax=Cylindrobasidium torrendii FP15055 ss-10 TaxID=1314674 RepID=A0A0D7BBH3_9AGAR|nr:hypothetical protein CYLTODRAFT_443992 [Cylindrobasidium torrendii FP15055 ss-10]
MPPRRPICPNQHLVDILEAHKAKLNSDTEKDSKLGQIYGKAIKSLKAHSLRIENLDDALALNGVGPWTVGLLKKGVNGADDATAAAGGGPSAPPTKKRPGQPAKESSTTTSSTSSSTRIHASSSSSSSSSSLPKAGNSDTRINRSVSLDAVTSTTNKRTIPLAGTSQANGSANFKFTFLGQCDMPVETSGNALFQDDCYRILYPKQPPSKIQESLLDIQSVDDKSTRFTAGMPQYIAKQIKHASNWDPFDFDVPSSSSRSHEDRLQATGSLLASLKNDTQGPKLNKSSIDPTRSLNPHLPSHGTRNPLQGSKAATLSNLKRSASLSQPAEAGPSNPRQPSRADMPPPSYIPKRSITMPSIPSSHRPPTATTDSANKTRPRGRPRLSQVIPNLPAEELDVSNPYATYDGLEYMDHFDITTHVEVIKANTFDIVLVLDTREVGVGKNRSAIFDGLCDRGVSVEQRPLNIGDVCWMARTRQAHKREFSLNYVLERKRMDDLFSSIKDGRFHEQKFRLHQSAMSHVFYVVEDYGHTLDAKDPTWRKAYDTVVSSTEAIDGFMMKETASQKYTINYYADLHSAIQEKWKDRDLYVLRDDKIRRHNYLGMQSTLRVRYPDQSFLTTWAAFQRLNSKSGFKTIRDTWARMLLCVSGMSPEKTSAVIEAYPTPFALWEAFIRARAREREDLRTKGREEMLGVKKKDMTKVHEPHLLLEKLGGGTRTVGKELSKKIYNVFEED